MIIQPQRAAMEARSYQSGGLPGSEIASCRARSIGFHRSIHPRKDLPVWFSTAKGMIALIENDAKAANLNFKAASDAADALPDFDETRPI